MPRRRARSRRRRGHIDRVHLHPERRRHGLDGAELADRRRVWRVPKDRYSCHARRNLLEQFQPFPAEAVFEREETGGVAARPREALDEAGADRIDRRSGTRPARCGSPAAMAPRPRLPAARMTSGASAASSAACLRISPALARGPAGVDAHVAADRSSPIPAAPAGMPPTRACHVRIVRSCGHEHADAPHPLGLLRARRERPAAAAPPSSVMNSRRLMCFPSSPRIGTLPHRCRKCRVVHHSKIGGRCRRWVIRVTCGNAAIRPELAHKQTYRRTCKMTRMTRSGHGPENLLSCTTAAS